MKLDWKTCFRAGASIFLLYLCITLWPNAARILAAAFSAASPLFIGCVIAYLVNLPMKFYEKHYFPKSKSALAGKTRRLVCTLAAFVTLVAVVILVINLVVPELISCIGVIFSALPTAINAIIDALDKIHVLPEDITAALNAVDWQAKISQILELLTSGVGNVVNVLISTVSSVFSGIVTGLVAIIFSIYLLLGKDDLSRQCDKLMRRYVKAGWYQKLLHVLTVLHRSFSRYIAGQCIEAVILGTLCALGMVILRMPYATMIGVLIAVTALIPVAGAYIGGGVGALMIFSVSPMQAVIFVVYLVILQQVEGNLIYPRVVGSSLGLPAIWVLAAVTIGGGVMGIAGMLLGVPIMAAIYQLVRETVSRSEPQPDE